MNEASQALDGSEETGSAAEPVRRAAAALASLRELGEPYGTLADRCESVFIDLQELSYDISALLSGEGLDPARTEAVEQRLELIRRLEKKYGGSVAQVLESQRSFQEELDRFASMDDAVAAQAAEDRRLLAVYRRRSAELTEARHRLAEEFERSMTGQLHELGMEKAVFRVAFAPKPEKPGLPQSLGDDAVEFMISANPGEPPKPLAKVASGGELSRVMLALKTMEAEQAGVGCMVFDEIDTGISGRMAQVVAEKMAAIARSRQVICVTHLPQIACMADHEFLVEKQVENGRTNTHVRLLDDRGRTEEIARMLSGTGGLTDSAVRHATEMLSEAAAYRASL